MRRLGWIVLPVLLVAIQLRGAETPVPGDLRGTGKVDFPVSCVKTAQPEFARGVALETQRAFEAALKIYPGRFHGLYGAAQAAEQIGDKASAQRFYAKLAAQTAEADASREELKRIRQYSNKVASAH